MRAYRVTRPGGPEVLELVDVPVPQPGAGEVLLRISAVGVNHHDVRERKRHDPAKPPEFPGLEAAGEVVAVGDGVERIDVGKQVCALLNGSGYAEFVAVPEAHCLPIPRGMSLVEAASLPETYFTVWSNVFDRAAIRPGESLLVHGGAGGIGVTAIQLARAFDSPVFATEGSREKCEACLALGATRAINYRDEDFVAIVREVTDGRGVDVVLDIIGGDYIPRGLSALADDGRLVMLAFPGGPTATVDLREIARRRLTLTGSALRPRPLAHKRAIAQALEQHVWPLFESGRLRPIIEAVLPLHEAPRAHALMEQGAHVGKIVLEV